MNWNVPAGVSPPYQVWRHTSDAATGATCIAADLSGASYEDTGATPGTIYRYWVRTPNTNGDSLPGQGYRMVAAALNGTPPPATRVKTAAIAVGGAGVGASRLAPGLAHLWRRGPGGHQPRPGRPVRGTTSSVRCGQGWEWELADRRRGNHPYVDR